MKFALHFIPVSYESPDEVAPANDDWRYLTIVNVVPIRTNYIRQAVRYSLAAVTCGLSALVTEYWLPSLQLWFRYIPCGLEKASHVVATTADGTHRLLQLDRHRVVGSDFAKILAGIGSEAEVDDCIAIREDSGNASRTIAASESSFPSINSEDVDAPRHCTAAVIGRTAENQIGLEESVFVTALSFTFSCRTFFYDPRRNRFAQVFYPIRGPRNNDVVTDLNNPLSQESELIASRRALFGRCLVDIPLKNPLDIALAECLHPFYLFQLCSLVLWLSDDYILYAGAVFGLSTLSLYSTITETLKANKQLYDTARYTCPIEVLRPPQEPSREPLADTTHRIIDSTELVPGDVIVLSRNLRLPCDVILLSGNALVDEALMTGESHPVHKSAVPKDEDFFVLESSKRHIIYGGSSVTDCSITPPLATVYRTGFHSVQGKMMRGLAYPSTPSKLNLDRESWKFVLMLGTVSIFTFALTLYQGIMNDLNLLPVLKRSLDTITIAVPPALPLIISVGIICAQRALKKNCSTTCLMPSRINVAGRVTTVIFDKTGTLTEDDTDLYQVLPVCSHVRSVEANPGFTSSSSSSEENQQWHQEELNVRFPRGPPGVRRFQNKSFCTLQTSAPGEEELGELAVVEEEDTGSQLMTGSERLLTTSFAAPVNKIGLLDEIITSSMATCHSLAIVDTGPVGNRPGGKQLVGNPLDYQMLEFTGFTIISHDISGQITDQCCNIARKPDVDPPIVCPTSNKRPVGSVDHSVSFCSQPPAYTILRAYEFDRIIGRQAVVVFDHEQRSMRAIAKGAPDSIWKCCTPESLPADFYEKKDEYCRQGLRVIAIASKPLPLICSSKESVEKDAFDEAQKLRRSDVESGLQFLGYLAYDNLLRKDSAATVAKLIAAGCAVMIATGDDAVTAMAVAYDVGIVSQNAKHSISGDMRHGELVWSKKTFFWGQQGEHQNSVESTKLGPLLHAEELETLALAISGEALRHIKSALNLDEEFMIETETSEFFDGTTKVFSASNTLGETPETFSSCEKIQRCHKKMKLLEFVVRYFHVFSRMKPSDKELLVKVLQAEPVNSIVSMCGDGANDCAAIKAADVGISISSRGAEAEASNAGAFNSQGKEKSISVVLDVLREGRGALASSIQSFQFVALYALIQLATVTILSHFGAGLSDGQFLYLDVIVVLPLTYFMSCSETSKELPRILPSGSLLALSIIVSLAGQAIIQLLFQLLGIFVLLPALGTGDFYTPFVYKGEHQMKGFENSIGFLISNLQTVLVAVILAFGTRPWKRVDRNVGFVLVAAAYTIFAFAFVLNEAAYVKWIRYLLDLESFPLPFRIAMLLLLLANILTSIAWDQILVRKILRGREVKNDMATSLIRQNLR